MRPFAPSVVFPVLTLIATSAAVDSDATCYFVNGNIAGNDVPCNITADVTTCCSKDDICLSNGLCYLQGSNGPAMSRGSCTDQNWGGDCAKAAPCKRWNQGNGHRVVNAIGNQYCCGNVVKIDDSSIECDVDRAFYVPTGSVIPGVAALSAYSTSTTEPSSTASSTASSNTTAVNSGDDSGVLPESSEGDSQKKQLAIGLGLGIPLAVIAGSALLWGGWERRKRTASLKELEQLKAASAVGAVGMAQNQYGYSYPQAYAAPPVEMDQHTVPIQELGATQYKDSSSK